MYLKGKVSEFEDKFCEN